MFKTPVLLICFNRPTPTRRVLESILAAEPQNLYVFQDGAREGKETDVQKCQAVRDVVKELTTLYSCENKDFSLHTNYSTNNLGCGRGPYTAISWLFENEECGIILEDDCVAHLDFFPYCEELLEKYKDDYRIGHIGGSNYGYSVEDASYLFSGGHFQTWGWATWKRSWEQMDYYLDNISFSDFRTIIRKYYKSFRQRIYWWYIFDMVKKDRMGESCWDYQYIFSYWKQRQLIICPKSHLVTNIGDGSDATHTHGNNDGMINRKLSPIMPLVHPLSVVQDWDYDDYMMRHFVISYEYGWNGIKGFPYRLNKLLKKLIGHEGPWIKRK